MSLDKYLTTNDDTVLHIRITSDVSINTVRDTVTSLQFHTYIISHEGLQDPDKRPHFHILGKAHSSVDFGTNYSKIRSVLNKSYGTGNSVYSISKVRSTKQLSKYVLKDGSPVLYQGFTSDNIEQLRDLSYRKGKAQFSTELSTLEDDYLLHKLTFESFVTSYVKLKIAYNHSVPRNSTINYLTKMRLRRDEHFVTEYVSSLLFHFQN